MKKVTWILLAAILISGLAGCHRTSGGRQADTPNGTYISAQEAREIALNHAGFTADQVRYLEVDSELHEKIPHYDVDFYMDNLDYEYEIDAVTGQILKSEVDR